MTDQCKRLFIGMVAATLLLAGVQQAAQAAPLRKWLPTRPPLIQDMAEEADDPATIPDGVLEKRDIPYGTDTKQRFDVYYSARATAAPIIFMVHGGGWRWGSKSSRAVVENKVARWVPMGLVVVSVDYRLLPQADPLEQARDIARALAAVQDKAASWGGDRSRIILMGHSAGAHLVALLDTTPAITAGVVTTPWLGTVSLDTASFNVPETMQSRHLRLYDNAFGTDPVFWQRVSPYHQLTKPARPLLAVCSTRRTDSCPQAQELAAKAATVGSTFTVLPKPFSHRDINQRLGEEPQYTQEVEAFMATLDSGLAALLKPRKMPSH